MTIFTKTLNALEHADILLIDSTCAWVCMCVCVCVCVLWKWQFISHILSPISWTDFSTQRHTHTHIHTERHAHAHSVTQHLIRDNNLSLTNPETMRTSLLNFIYFVVALNNNIKSILLKERLGLIFKAKRQIRLFSVFVISDCVAFASSIWSDLNFAWKSLGVPKYVFMMPFPAIKNEMRFLNGM